MIRKYSPYTRQINKVVDYITNHMEQPIRVEQLASVAGLSLYHFHRIFTAETGEPAGKFITRKRMEKAARMLLQDYDMPVGEIAYCVGYSTPAVFCRNFKSHFGLTAQDFRRKNKEENSKNRQFDSIDKTLNPYASRYLCPYKTIKIGDKTMKCTFEIKDLEARKVIYCRHIGAFDKIGEAFDKLMKWAYPRGLVSAQPLMAAVYLDDPDITPVEKLQSDACLVVDHDVKVEGEIGMYTLNAGKYGVGRFEIAMNEFSDAWHAICGLVEENGCQTIDGHYYELYLNDPNKHPEKKHIVDICVPVKPL